MSVQSLNNQTLQLRELNISNEYLQGTPGFVLQSNSLTTDIFWFRKGGLFT